MSMLPESARAVIGQPHPTRPGSAQDARERRLHLGQLHRHFRRRTDGDGAHRQYPDDPRGHAAAGARPGCRRRTGHAGRARRGCRTSSPATPRSKSTEEGVGHRSARLAELLDVGRRRSVSWRSRADGAHRDQFRRDRRAEPQLCRPQLRQCRVDGSRRAGVAAARGGARRVSRRCARTSRSASRRGFSCRSRAPTGHGWRSSGRRSKAPSRSLRRTPCRPRRCGPRTPPRSRPRRTPPTASAT